VSRLALLGTVANGFQLEAVGVEPVRGKTVFPVLGELAWWVQDDGLSCT